MIGRARLLEDLTRSKIPITFEVNQPSVFWSRNILSVFEDPNNPEEKAQITEEEGEEVLAENVVQIWNDNKTWFWHLQSDKIHYVGLYSMVSTYKSFLEMLWLTSFYFSGPVVIHTQSAAHIKCLRMAMA